MSWYRIKSYGNVKHINLSSRPIVSSGLTLIFAADSPFCVRLSEREGGREFRLLKNDFCLIFAGAQFRVYTDPNTETRIISLELETDVGQDGYHSIKRLCDTLPEAEKCCRAVAHILSEAETMP